MSLFGIFTILLALSAAFGYLNHKYLKMPFTIGIMVISIFTSIAVIGLGYINPGIYQRTISVISGFDFHNILMNVMLSFLLFAGAININLQSLKEERLSVITLATFGVLISTFIVGTLIYYVLKLFNLDIAYVYCLLFGALISPTDPIAVLGILKHTGIPRSLEIKITGESLFNDGVAVVVFISIYQLAEMGSINLNVSQAVLLMLREAGGGIVFGFILGYAGYFLLKSIDNYQVEVMITLALVAGGYSLADSMLISGPLSIVIAGIIIGNRGREFAMSVTTREYLDKFWELVDIILNAMLFILIGFEILILKIDAYFFAIGLAAVLIVLISRMVSVSVPIYILGFVKDFSRNEIGILTWGGLRGGISVALALSLSQNMYRELFVSITYVVVLFSIIVQGLTIGKYIKKVKLAETQV